MKKLLLIITIFISLISQAQVNVTVDYQPLMDRLDSIEQRLKSAGSGGGYDLTYIEHDIADIKQRLSIIENYNVDYSAPIGELYDAVNEINEKVNNLPTRTDTVYIVGEGGEQPDYSQDITDLKYMVAALADRVNSISTGTTGDVTGLPYAAASLGLKAGYDITDELNNLNAPLVLFDGGAYLISGDVDAKGATYMFRPGSRIAGRGTIKNVKIDAGDYQIFDLHIDLRNASTTGDRVWWTWWGAKADDPDFDNTPYLQQGIDMVIANPTLPRRFYGNPGTYLSLIHI